MILLRLAEVLLSLIFVLGGLGTLRDPEPRAKQLVRFSLPLPMLLVRVNGAIMVVGGLALALNFRAALASIALAAVLLPTTIVGHAFWAEEGPRRQQQRVHFVKNLAVLGGLIAMIVAATAAPS